MRKAILFLGVGNLNIGIIDIAQKQGYATICVNRDQDSASLEKADLSKVQDSGDIASILDFVFLEAGNFDIKLVYSGSEFFVAKETVSYALGLPHNSLPTAFAGENKQVMKTLFTKHRVPAPQGVIVSNFAEAAKSAKQLKYPVIIKPTNKLGGLGVGVSHNEHGLKAAFEAARTHSKVVVVERFYEGSLHDVNGFFYDGSFFRAGISDKKASVGSSKYVSELTCPSTLSAKQKDQLYRLLEKSAKALGIVCGPIKGDAILSREGFLMMEVGLRFHGPLGSLFCLPYGEGFLPFEYYLKTINCKNFKFKKTNKFVLIKQISVKPGIIKKVEGEARAKKVSGVVDILLQKKIGDRIGKIKSNYDVVGYVVICAKDRDSAQQIYIKFLRTFQVIVE